MAPEVPELHIFLVPLMAPGHTNPMVDMARLLAERGVKATLITTPSNAPLLCPAIDKARRSGHRIDLMPIRFPSSKAVFPEGHENLTSLSTPLISAELFAALELFCQSLDPVLREHLPDCIIFDSFLPWTADVALRLRIPSLVFHGFGFFPLCVMDSLRRHSAAGGFGGGGSDTVVVPGIPHRVEMKISQIPCSIRTRNEFSEFFDRMVESELKSRGAVVNSFYEMEPDYADHYRDVMGLKAWHVGPVSLCNRDIVDMAGRGAASSYSASIHSTIISWLDSKPTNSVVYVCFGSLCRLTAAQLQEIAVGLEASNHPFIWALRDEGPDGPVIREEGKGVVVRGWAPQMLVLSHRAVGGFVTHCGWNSVTEGVSAGVPMITWPLFAEQFFNECLVVDVLGIGVRVGVEVWAIREEEKPVVMGAEFGRAVARLMDGGEEADGVRRRAGELREKATRAVEEGGSSDADVGRLIGELIERRGDGGKYDFDSTSNGSKNQAW